MRVYIDEAGIFLPPTTDPYSFSLVLGLVVPSSVESELFYEFLRLRDAWPNQVVEIKGSSLNERQAAEVIDLVCRHGALVEFFALDMDVHRADVVDEFKAGQALAIVENLTDAHHDNIVRLFHDQARAIRTMSNQLFLQAYLTIRLIHEIIQVGTLYFVQRQPRELGDIAWVIDRKDRTITQMEETWTTLILPFSEGHFARNPLQRVTEADYSHFQRYKLEQPEGELRRHMEWLQEMYGVPDRLLANGVVDAKKILSEKREFKDSRDSLGLQLADMLAATLRRAMNGHLAPSGWIKFGTLLVRKNDARLLALGKAAKRRVRIPKRALQVCRTIDDGAQSMIIEDDPDEAIAS
jgi:hypothetical protein